MIDKYIEFNSLNESKEESKFKVGDTVIVNDKLSEIIEKYDWNIIMKKYIGETFFIKRIDYDEYRKRYKYYIFKNTYVYEDCIDLIEPIEPLKVRWYKKGKFDND
jgi:hypothetical protein